MPPVIKHPSSYRDPSGFLFYHNDILYRQVNRSFQDDYDLFISSGLYQHLVDRQLLIPHKTIPENVTGSEEWYQTLQPEKLAFISYPYEWCFDMLKDAALLTLEIAEEAMKYGMLLKDASAYNLQWHQGKMIFIDTLSFEKYDESKPWIAYRQFCEHFLAPLALMHYRKWPLQDLLLAYPDGIPLELTKKLLPASSKFNLHTFLHLHLHARYAGKPHKAQTEKPFSAAKLKNLFKSLMEAIHSFSLNTSSGVWSHYYKEASQREDYIVQKKKIISDWISMSGIRGALDMGANEGAFSQLLSEKNIFTVSADSDHYSINSLYKKIKEESNPGIVPLVIDLTHPSPAIGVNNRERSSFFSRSKTDLVLALALIHHLAIGKNIPFEEIAGTFSALCNYLIIEFIPKEDEKTRLMLLHKKDIYYNYNEEHFEKVFEKCFTVLNKQQVGHSGRILYLMKKICPD